jgi:outer membrane protein assembly factor BamA
MRAHTETKVRIGIPATHVETLDESNHSESCLIVESIDIEGNHWIPAELIRAAIKTRPGSRFDRSAIMNDLRAIDSLGYFDAHRLQVIPEMTSNTGVRLRIRVVENALVRKFSFAGNWRISRLELNRLFVGQLWKPQNPYELQAAISEIQKHYRKLGIPFAKVELINLPDETVGVLISETNPAIIKVPVRNGVPIFPSPVRKVPQVDERIMKFLRDRAVIPAPRVIPLDLNDVADNGLSDAPTQQTI